MPHIQVLDQITIDKIAAGEVIERPSSIVKELVENAIDAQATSITVEIQDGGISLIRITDNGSGILREDVSNAFLRHSTSKIRQVEDLTTVKSLGFRGEALSSIAAVTQTELITKTKEETYGTRYVIEGGREQVLEDIGAPDGTTFLIRQLFYNVPARRKFLKTPPTEAGHIQDLLIHLALSHPEISFLFLNNNHEKLRTSGNGKLKDVIYHIYGREVAANLLEMNYQRDGLLLTGYLGNPTISRGNRNFECFFVNGRYVKSAMISKAVEDAYKDFVMHHKFPFVVLHFQMNGEDIDVNVHPTKMELRFQKQQQVYNILYEGVHQTLLKPELIPVISIPDPVQVSEKTEVVVSNEPKPMDSNDKPCENHFKEHTISIPPGSTSEEDYFLEKMKERVHTYHNCTAVTVEENPSTFDAKETKDYVLNETTTYPLDTNITIESGQLNLFEEKLLRREVRADYQLIGQLFDTYWIVQFQENLYIIDQHAAHERVLYERTLQSLKQKEFTSQYLSPPIILSLTMQEIQLIQEHMSHFKNIGFELEPFGGDEYAVRAIPGNLFGIAKKDLLMEMIDRLSDGITSAMAPHLIDEKIASISCKAAVKGNNRLSTLEIDALIGELLTLDNPYHCPHGRPTIISMTKRELEKKFKRIL